MCAHVRYKAQQEHDETKEMFETLNVQLIEELPQLMDLRVPYFDPSFEAMIRMQAKFAEEGYEKLSGVQRYAITCCDRGCSTDSSRQVF